MIEKSIVGNVALPATPSRRGVCEGSAATVPSDHLLRAQCCPVPLWAGNGTTNGSGEHRAACARQSYDVLLVAVDSISLVRAPVVLRASAAHPGTAIPASPSNARCVVVRAVAARMQGERWRWFGACACSSSKVCPLCASECSSQIPLQ